ncbi:SBBP repeat-containing protein [Stigmatella hybrida]|uniref:SBBP repeat-containing protein n=1 Tax=Stigmatella hybrida TaxID=394097 RepID=UPI001CDAB288|nr:SBBP repeat-containing protein [Stigmatella hybrida]
MSVYLSFRTLLAATAAGTLAAGCSPEELPAAPTHGGFEWSTQGWSLVGTHFGTYQHDEATDLWVHPYSGAVYVSGYENGSLGQSAVEPSGNADGLIISLPSNLDWQQAKVLKFESYDGKAEVIEAIGAKPVQGQETFDLYFAGRTAGTFGTANAGQFDTLVGWTNHGLSSKKVFQFGTERPQHPRRLALDGRGGIVVSGYDDIYIPSNYVETWEDPFVMKLQRSNDTLAHAAGWPLQFSTPFTDTLPGMAMKTEANAPIYITGANAAGSGRGMFVKKLRPDGSLEWTAQQSPISLDMGAALHVLPDNTVLFAGSSYADFGQGTIGEQDVVVRRLRPDNNGQPIWTKTYGTTSSEWVTDLTVDADGNIYVVGQTLGSFDPNIPPSLEESDIFLLKLAPDGTSPQYFQIGSPGEDYPASVAVNGNGDIFVAGYTTGPLIPGKPYKAGRDGFVFRVTPPGFGTGSTRQ